MSTSTVSPLPWSLYVSHRQKMVACRYMLHRANSMPIKEEKQGGENHTTTVNITYNNSLHKKAT